MITRINVKGFKVLKDAKIDFYTTKNIADKNKNVTRKHKLNNGGFIYTFNLAGLIGSNATGKSSFLDAILLYKGVIMHNSALKEKSFKRLYSKEEKNFTVEYLINGEILKHEVIIDEEFNVVREKLSILTSNLSEKQWREIFINDKKYSLFWRVFELSKYEKEEVFNFEEQEMNIIKNIFTEIKKIVVFSNNFVFAGEDFFSESLKWELKRHFYDKERTKRYKTLINLLKLLLTAADSKINDLEYDSAKDEIIVISRSAGKNIKVPFDNISDGTKRFIYLLKPIFSRRSNTNFYLIDEIENSLHPKLIDTILRLFYFNDNNVNNSQLIFTTHNPYILDAAKIHNSCINLALMNDNENFKKLSNFEKYNRNDKLFAKNYMLEIFNSHPDDNNVYDIYDNFSNNKTNDERF